MLLSGEWNSAEQIKHEQIHHSLAEKLAAGVVGHASDSEWPSAGASYGRVLRQTLVLSRLSLDSLNRCNNVANGRRKLHVQALKPAEHASVWIDRRTKRRLVEIGQRP